MQWNRYAVYALYVVGRAVCKGFDVLACYFCCPTLHCAVCQVIVYNKQTWLNTSIAYMTCDAYVYINAIADTLCIRIIIC